MPGRLPFLSSAIRDAMCEMVLRAAELDHTLEWAIATVLGDRDRTSKFLLGNLSGDRQARLLCHLLADQYPDEEEEINKLLARLIASKQARNEIIHWIADETPNVDAISLLEQRPHREEKITLKTADDIKKLAEDLDWISDKIRQYGERAGEDMLQAWRDRRDWQAHLVRSRSAPALGQIGTSEPPALRRPTSPK